MGSMSVGQDTSEEDQYVCLGYIDRSAFGKMFGSHAANGSQLQAAQRLLLLRVSVPFAAEACMKPFRIYTRIQLVVSTTA